MAITVLHEAARVDATLMAPEALWHHADVRGRTNPRGTSVEAVSDALRDHGQPPEADWPFAPYDHTPQSAPDGAGAPPWHRGESEWVSPTATDVEFEIAGGRPVAVVIELTEVFFTLSGVELADPEADAEHGGYHAVVVVAVGVRDGARWFLLQNSWGPSWGRGGFAWISEAHFNERITQAVTVSTQISRTPLT